MRELQVNAADEIRIFMVSSSDHITPVTGATVAVSLLKKGATTFAAGAGTVTEAGGGWYIYYATAADTNTFGPLAVRAVATGCDAYNTEYQVKYAALYVKSTVKTDEFGTSLDLTSTMKASVNAEADTALSDVGLSTTVTDRIDASISSRLASTSITLNAGKVTVGTNDDKTGYTLTQAFPANFAALGIAPDGNLLKVNTLDGHTPQTGDSYAKITDATYGLAKLVRATTPANTLDIDANGDVTVGSFNSSLDLTSTMKTSINAEADAALSDVGLSTTVTDRIDASVSSRLASANITLSGGAVTVGTNNDKTGYSLTQSFPSNFSSLAINASGQVTTGAFASTLDFTTNMNNSVASYCSMSLNSYNAVKTSDLSTLATASDLATVDTIVDAILVDTGTTIPAQITSLQSHGDSTWATATGFAVQGSEMSLTSGIISSLVDAIWDEVINSSNHTVSNSSGLRLKNLSDNVIYIQSGQGGDGTSYFPSY